MKNLVLIVLALVLLFACDPNEQQSNTARVLDVKSYFEASQINIEPGTIVYFNDLSRSNPNSWLWEFEGGEPSTSTDQNPAIKYNQLGLFSVTLTVTNENSEDKRTFSNYIYVSNDEPQRSEFAGKWILQNLKKAVNTKKNETIDKGVHSSTTIKTKNEFPNLMPYTPHNWDNSILVKNKEVNDAEYFFNDDISVGDDLYLSFSYINQSESAITTPFSVSILIDDVEVVSFLQEEDVLGNYYWTHFNYLVENHDLSPGNHSISMKIDSDNDIVESFENDNVFTRNFSVYDPSEIFHSFEFHESRYIVTQSDGISIYGTLSDNNGNSNLMLDGFGSISILSANSNEISFTLETDNKSTERFTVNAFRVGEIGGTEMTRKLSYDVWVLESVNGDNNVLYTEWLFGKSGDYIEFIDGELDLKYWNYINENSLGYGNFPSSVIGSININNISYSELNITDANGSNLLFKRYN